METSNPDKSKNVSGDTVLLLKKSNIIEIGLVDLDIYTKYRGVNIKPPPLKVENPGNSQIFDSGS